jgi:putative RNA 2'-phosphotransferase
MIPTPLVRLSKLLALILRHQPERFGVNLDAEGYASLAEVLLAVNTRLPEATLEDVQRVVDTLEPDKQRYTILDGEIRANYGHSLAGRIEHAAAQPPEVLLHGTAESAVASILQTGLVPMRRQYVHLTADHALAQRVGARHGRAYVLNVAAAQAASDGVVFYRANPAFWLVSAVPARYISRSLVMPT